MGDYYEAAAAAAWNGQNLHITCNNIGSGLSVQTAEVLCSWPPRGPGPGRHHRRRRLMLLLDACGHRRRRRACAFCGSETANYRQLISFSGTTDDTPRKQVHRQTGLGAFEQGDSEVLE